MRQRSHDMLGLNEKANSATDWVCLLLELLFGDAQSDYFSNQINVLYHDSLIIIALGANEMSLHVILITFDPLISHGQRHLDGLHNKPKYIWLQITLANQTGVHNL
ncbi:hypothetical protein LXL04_039609 [Taraxacum kok-saghyz]